MAFLTPPAWLENSSAHNAVDYRAVLASLARRTSGVAGPDDLEVTEKSGTPNMSVDVAAGGVFVMSTRSDADGMYHAYNDATITVTIAAADASNPRIDRILVQVRDEEQDAALTQNDVRILVVQGTPAASPTAPTITVEDFIELAQVEVPASATSITNANITDMRSRAAGLGGAVVCTSGSRPSHRPGQMIYESDGGELLVSDGTSWDRVYPAVVSASMVTGQLAIANGGTGASTASAARTNLGVRAGSATGLSMSGVSYQTHVISAPGITSSSVVVATVRSSNNDGLVCKIVSKRRGSFTVLVVTNSGATATVAYALDWVAVG